ncbi:MAG: hypothetical protein Q4P78_04255 [Rothia sp. (in: high G+C Gram-positive bacteria)]|uniref:hypothetical protein n=1 Tax=Rothia sp. (in: high G+C Gram-positive bacteria) TaxID=1885016 RepID=UPI0026DF904E|nr:hypothetical protein [Rothia sp. (in: high G+C Gram-positive bacteria)]MDO5750402.1 hypothetical protein [Rothia sp. (in: high G+C Gram-positive bacteria)]
MSAENSASAQNQQSSKAPFWRSVSVWISCALILLLVTINILPLEEGVRMAMTGVLVFAALFTLVEAKGLGKLLTAFMGALLSLALVATVQLGSNFLSRGGAADMAMGIALMVLPLLGAWALVAELLFGLRVQRLADEMEAAGELPEDTLPRTPSGRVDKEAAAAEFEKYAAIAAENPGSAYAWFNVATLYDACGERKQARKSMRTAVALHRGRVPAHVRADSAEGSDSAE